MKCRFEIVGLSGIDGVPMHLKINGKSKYSRILIKKVKEEDIKEPKDVALLMQYNKKFLIIGNNNAISYKDFFHYIKDGKVWLGRTLFTGKMPFFRVSSDYNLTNSRFEKREDGLYKQVNGVCWFANLSNDDKRETLVLYKKYNAEEYPKYDNYDAIEVSKVKDIPIDFDGVIGMPITGLKYLWSDGKIHAEINGKDTQFEIKGLDRYVEDNPRYGHRFHINGKETYARICIKKK